jgi:DNA-binding Lrp family transcriptional regulator
MVRAFLTINTVPDKIENVLEDIKKIDGVEETHMLYGIYDIIAKVRAANIKELRELILKIRKMSDISFTSIQLVINNEQQTQVNLNLNSLSVSSFFQ